jgi:adenine-specific DNA-methyltransferase
MRQSALARYCARGSDYDDALARAIAEYRMSWYTRHLCSLEEQAFERYGESVVNAFFEAVLLERKHVVVHAWRHTDRVLFVHRLEPYSLLGMAVRRYPREYSLDEYRFTAVVDASLLGVRGKPSYQFACLGRDSECWHFWVGHDATRPQTTPEELYDRAREHGDDAPLPYYLKRFMDRYIKAPREGLLVLRYPLPFLQAQWAHMVGRDAPYELFESIAVMEGRLYESYINAPVQSMTHWVSLGWLVTHCPDLWCWVRESPAWAEQVAWWRENGFLGADDQFVDLDVQPTLTGDVVFRPAWAANLPLQASLFEGLDDALAARVPMHACDGVLVHADALQGLVRAREWYGDGAFRMAYIDPPYNLKTEVFAYYDRYDTDEWLCMLSERLAYARPLLDDAGVCMVSIAHTEPAVSSETVHLQMAASRIFPRRLGELIWRKRTHFGTKTVGIKNLSENHEYICLYGNSRARLNRFIVRGDRDDFPEVDADSGERYRWRNAHEIPMFTVWKQSLFARNPKTVYDVLVDPKTLTVVGFRYRYEDSVVWLTNDETVRARAVSARSPDGGHWIFSVRRLMQEAARGNMRVVQSETGDYIVQLRHYIPREPLRSILSDNPMPMGTYRDGRAELENELGTVVDAERFRPKPLSLMKALLLASSSDGERVLDFFAGTGTTALAAMDLRHELGERRPFLCVEESDTSFPVCVKRVVRHMASPHWENGRMKQPKTETPTPFIVRVVSLARWNPPDV